ncbi:hypothetical protein MPTK2_4g01090 [Marchantia polymorpha subsp. ruderalis]
MDSWFYHALHKIKSSSACDKLFRANSQSPLKAEIRLASQLAVANEQMNVLLLPVLVSHQSQTLARGRNIHVVIDWRPAAAPDPYDDDTSPVDLQCHIPVP